MQSKRDYLVSLNLAKPGRGKFSNAAKDALRKAEAEGVKFSDATGPVTVVSKSDQNSGKTVPAPVNPGDSAYILPSDFRFPEAEYKAVAVNGGKVYSMRECCNRCRVSLVNHACNEPTIHNNIAVHIRSK